MCERTHKSPASCTIALRVLAAVDVLRVVARDGAATLNSLLAAFPDLPEDEDDGFLAALDAAVEHGYLRLRGYRNGEGHYRLTQRGRLALQASAMSMAAA